MNHSPMGARTNTPMLFNFPFCLFYFPIKEKENKFYLFIEELDKLNQSMKLSKIWFAQSMELEFNFFL